MAASKKQSKNQVKPHAILLSRTELTSAARSKPSIDTAKRQEKPVQTAKPARKSAKKADPKTSQKPAVKQPRRNWFTQLLANKWFRYSYALGALLVLVATTLLWSVWGAKLHSLNADQLVDPYLFGSGATFHGATFPGAHSFLLKWPIFWLVAHFGMSSMSLMVATAGAVLLTVLVLAAVLYGIDRRPLVFGTICLFLALMLLLVPTQPYPGALLPVNMAMLTTRNLEYALYIVALVFVIWAGRVRSWYSLAALGCLTLLIASDKLFASLGLGSALIITVLYALCQNWQLVRLGVRWLCTVLVATVFSTVLLASLQLAGVTHFASSSNISPYGLTNTPKDGVLGVVYGTLGFLTNFGANPAYAANVLRDIPARASHELATMAGFAYCLAFAAVVFGLLHVWLVVRPTLQPSPAKKVRPVVATELSLLLIASTITAAVVFVATKHYYAVDARYLTIAVFAVFVATATSLRSKTPRPEVLTLCGALALLGIALAVVSAGRNYAQNTAALSDLRHRSYIVAQALEHHKVAVLAGDYWRVLPAKFLSAHDMQVMPFSGCTDPRADLSSTAWQPDLHKTSFAYLLSLDRPLTDYPQCTLDQVLQAYGQPNASLVVSGTLSNPKELVLFYDHGINKPGVTETDTSLPPTSVLPVGLTDLPSTSCEGTTAMNIVAHEDDDLLFLSPDLLHTVQSGDCVRTVFLTAGDSGHNKFYWVNRQLGAQAAYDTMLGKKDVWVQRIVRLADNRYISVSSPKSDPKISLIFFNLPDGGLQGNGFPSSHFESLAKLYGGETASIQSVDRQSRYDKAELTQALSSLMNIYQPSVVRTQADVYSANFPDHSDHIATGHFATDAANQYSQVQFAGNFEVPVVRYIGYPVHGYEPNVGGDDLAKKEAAFLAYARFDGGVCQSALACAETPTYGSYITRQYTDGE